MLATRELVDLITYGREERRLEYKKSMDWNDPDTKARITRCILGMANLRDGGFIVLGVEQRGDTLEPIGMRPSHAESFSQDDVAAYVNERADPFVEIDINRVSYDSKEFLVIRVKEFAVVPVICRKEIHLGGKLIIRKGAVCTRSTRIPETVEVPSQTEMREIISLAADKEVRGFMERLGRTGILSALLEPSDTEQYDQQLGDMR